MREVATSVVRNLRNLPGWRTKEKIVVLESDDWGSIRVPSRSIRDEFARMGFPADQWNYNHLDALESNTDLEALFDVLRRHKDSDGRPAVLTANVILGNPDFDQIRQSDFSEYHWEPVSQTVSRYPQHDRVIDLYAEGMKSGIFYPQLHGREHLQVNRWMKALQQPLSLARKTFSYGSTYSGAGDYNYMEAFDFDEPSESAALEKILSDAAVIFNNTFGFRSRSFISPCYTWSDALERIMPGLGIQYLQGASTQLIPLGGFGNYSTRRSSLGRTRESGVISLLRNAFLEPALVKKTNWVNYTFRAVEDAFRWGKPAVICAHRINFIGYIEETNRRENLELLDQLLTRILRRWPSTKFMTSDQLGDLVMGKATIHG